MRSVKVKRHSNNKKKAGRFDFVQAISSFFVYKRADRRARTTTTVFRKSILYQGVAVLACGALFAAYLYELPQQAWNATTQAALTTTARAGFQLGEVLVNGRQYATVDKILSAVQVTVGESIFKRSVTDIQKSLEEISWIKSAVVQRRLPATLYIQITERQPIALWQHQKVHYLVDAEGVVISSSDLLPFAHLPIIVGGDAPVHAPSILNLLSKFTFVKERVTAIIRVGGRRWNVQLDRNTEVKLPEQKPEEALARLNLLLEQKKIDTSEVKIVDLRLPDKMIVSLTPTAEVKLKGKGKVV